MGQVRKFVICSKVIYFLEMVEKFVERVETCTALEDRRDALRALRSMVKVGLKNNSFSSVKAEIIGEGIRKTVCYIILFIKKDLNKTFCLNSVEMCEFSKKLIVQKYRLAVGTMGMNVFMEILDKERSNPELLTLTLETLVAVLSSDDENTDEDELGERLAEVIFLSF